MGRLQHSNSLDNCNHVGESLRAESSQGADQMMRSEGALSDLRIEGRCTRVERCWYKEIGEWYQKYEMRFGIGRISSKMVPSSVERAWEFEVSLDCQASHVRQTLLIACLGQIAGSKS